MQSQQPPTNLTLEQQFFLTTHAQLATKASKEQLIELYKDLLVSYLTQANYYKELVKHEWKLDEPFKRPAEKESSGEDSNYQAS